MKSVRHPDYGNLLYVTCSHERTLATAFRSSWVFISSTHSCAAAVFFFAPRFVACSLRIWRIFVSTAHNAHLSLLYGCVYCCYTLTGNGGVWLSAVHAQIHSILSIIIIMQPAIWIQTASTPKYWEAFESFPQHHALILVRGLLFISLLCSGSAIILLYASIALHGQIWSHFAFPTAVRLTARHLPPFTRAPGRKNEANLNWYSTPRKSHSLLYGVRRMALINERSVCVRGGWAMGCWTSCFTCKMR